MKNNELTAYLNRAIEKIVGEVLKNTIHNPKETAFLLQYRRASKKAAQKRSALEAQGRHLPAFLISSITNSCNLFCKGCYARANGICAEQAAAPLLSAEEWDAVFEQSSSLGISFHLLAGGEPLLRQDVLRRAGGHPDTVFPVFTNGTLLDGELLGLFDRHRNLIPVLSIEGGQKETDSRRGDGVHQLLRERMEQLNRAGILYGCSVTVSKRNLEAVTQPDFIEGLHALGCRIVLFVEYVPVDGSAQLAFEQPQREALEASQTALRRQFPAIVFLSFPGDEKQMGGCLAAGRGFFHINPNGEAEACPFAPYSDRSLKTHTLLEVLDSPFFEQLQQQRLAGGEHLGGCALFEQRARVQEILSQMK